ncbi:hypothetical protein M6B38_233810 [Iris pallida]|uniref:Uncharacterized protein n=1 Tax=Iris pallida TaxID=29817 RepID=A0AAX6DQY3_IRIPA|nr:hypothetical protein M6B38_233810 [Iris pallida]
MAVSSTQSPRARGLDNVSGSSSCQRTTPFQRRQRGLREPDNALHEEAVVLYELMVTRRCAAAIVRWRMAVLGRQRVEKKRERLFSREREKK